ncbi:hypothetical protein [Saccharothrix xinjiangensis]|uniref:Uncharacterized protein n=1 Tax=Saccharothrix xinjiangensis TaxID=204798 RepID=A0ABV9YE06_9PSEU
MNGYIAPAMGFRPDATALEWLAVIGLLGLLTFALTWPAAASGLVTEDPEQASNTPPIGHERCRRSAGAS